MRFFHFYCIPCWPDNQPYSHILRHWLTSVFSHTPHALYQLSHDCTPRGRLFHNLIRSLPTITERHTELFQALQCRQCLLETRSCGPSICLCPILSTRSCDSEPTPSTASALKLRCCVFLLLRLHRLETSRLVTSIMQLTESHNCPSTIVVGSSQPTETYPKRGRHPKLQNSSCQSL